MFSYQTGVFPCIQATASCVIEVILEKKKMISTWELISNFTMIEELIFLARYFKSLSCLGQFYNIFTVLTTLNFLI